MHSTLDIVRATARDLARSYLRDPFFVIREVDLQVRAVGSLEQALQAVGQPLHTPVARLVGGLQAFDQPRGGRCPRVCTELKPTAALDPSNTKPSDIVLLRNAPVDLNRDGYGVRSLVQEVALRSTQAVLELKLIGVSSRGVAERYLMEDVRKLRDLAAVGKPEEQPDSLGLFVLDTSLPLPSLRYDEGSTTMRKRAGRDWPWPGVLLTPVEPPPSDVPTGVLVWTLSLEGFDPSAPGAGNRQPWLTEWEDAGVSFRLRGGWPIDPA